MGDGKRVHAGQYWVERRGVEVKDGQLRLRMQPGNSPGQPFASIAALRIFPAGTTLEVAEEDRFAEPRSVRSQAEIPGTPVEFVAGKMVPLETIAKPTSPVMLLSDEDRPGMWCWFQDPRAITDAESPKGTMLLAGW